MNLSPTSPTVGLQLLQYGLPLLLGYVLYVGIAGRWRPVRPARPEDRPDWLLGAWVGLSVAAIAGTTMHLAHGLPLERAPELFRDAAWWLVAALLPGFAVRLAHRASRRRGRDAFVDPAGDPARTTIAIGVDGRTLDEGLPDDGQTLVDEARAEARDEPRIGEARDEGPDVAAEALRERGGVLYVPIENPDEAGVRRALDDERRLREETEKHLQVTRRALYSLDASAREGDDARTETLIALETELEAHVRRSAAAEARATREECGRMQAETTASKLKREVLRLRSEMRRTAEARARAVATAGKSVAFARRSLQARTTLEERLRETEEALVNRQETISSLIRALEAEKGRTEEQVASRARQLVLHERQLRERRSLETAARGVEGKLSTRLVKKVARARPLAGT